MTESAAMARTLPIPTVAAEEIAADTELFYRLYAATPVIVRGCFAPGHPLARLDLETIDKALGDVLIHVYGSEQQGYSEVPARVVIAGLRGHGAPHNVVDFYIAGTPLGELFEVPPFLRQNWYLGAPAHRDEVEKSLVLSPAGSFTALHLDAYGMQGWMYLVAGRKTWRFYSPDSLAAAFDPVRHRFYDPRRDSLDQFPNLALCDGYEASMQAGDLLYFPAGWIHQVTTHEMSFGVGGSLLNDYQIEQHMRWWLWERALELEGSLDLKRVIQEMPESRFSGPAGRARAGAAVRLCEEWEAMRGSAGQP